MNPLTLALERSVSILLYNIDGTTHNIESVPRLLGDGQEFLPYNDRSKDMSRQELVKAIARLLILKWQELR